MRPADPIHKYPILIFDLDASLVHPAARGAGALRVPAPYPGVFQFLESQLERGARMAVCSERRPSETMQILARFELLTLFEAVAGTEEANPQESGVAMIRRALAPFGVRASQALVFGASERDMQSAARAGCHFIQHQGGFGAFPHHGRAIPWSFAGFAELMKGPSQAAREATLSSQNRPGLARPVTCAK